MNANRGAAPSASRLANVAAPVIARGFDDYQERFEGITRRASARFADRDWHGSLADAVDRLDLYGQVVQGIEAEIRWMLGGRVSDRLVWAGMKAVYSGLIAGRDDWELAETFFNSLTRRIFSTVGVDPNMEFVATDFDPPSEISDASVLRTYEGGDDPAGLVETILSDAWFDAPYEDLTRDARAAAHRLVEHLRALGQDEAQIERVEMVRAPFYRRKGAYLVGRMSCSGESIPLVFAVVHPEAGVVVDAVIMDEDDVSILFSFTRSHFHVDVGPARLLVHFLSSLMPRKRVAELYIAVGYHKHGKTELYRNLLAHLSSTDERFQLAPGTPGLVMVVFTMPDYDLVFKVIRDRFPPSKTVTRGGVMQQYRLVFRHDRAGRLVEAQEFEHLEFDRARFDPEVVEELERQATRTVVVSEETVVLHHVYVERRVTPLDVHVREAPPDAAQVAVLDFGQALKDLAATNIFPGDLLPKNFGLTRHGRVVCYDYDELSLMTDFEFRAVPKPQSYEDELSDEAWYGAGPMDVFPEEFPRFISIPQEFRQDFNREHRDLFTLEFWQEMKDRIERRELVDIYPYPPSLRLQAEAEPAREG